MTGEVIAEIETAIAEQPGFGFDDADSMIAALWPG